MNRIENSWIWLPERAELVWLATWVVIWPARCSWSPGGACARAKESCSDETTAFELAMSLRDTSTRTLSCAACPSAETSGPRMANTPLTPDAANASRDRAARSAGVRLPAREATIRIWPAFVPPSSGAARFAASVLGAVERRNALLSLLTSFESEGKALTVTTAASSHSTRTTQRNRTMIRASASNVLSIEKEVMA
jgi:hypothetical protein